MTSQYPHLDFDALRVQWGIPDDTWTNEGEQRLRVLTIAGLHVIDGKLDRIIEHLLGEPEHDQVGT